MRADDPQRFAIRCPANHFTAIQNPFVTTIFTEDSMLTDIDGYLLRKKLVDFLINGFLVVGMHALVPFIEGIADLVLGKTEHGFPLLREKYLVRCRIPIP